MLHTKRQNLQTQTANVFGIVVHVLPLIAKRCVGVEVGDTLQRILRNLNFCDIEQLDKQGKFSKHRPVINELVTLMSF